MCCFQNILFYSILKVIAFVSIVGLIVFCKGVAPIVSVERLTSSNSKSVHKTGVRCTPLQIAEVLTYQLLATHSASINHEINQKWNIWESSDTKVIYMGGHCGRAEEEQREIHEVEILSCFSSLHFNFMFTLLLLFS